MQVGGVVVWKQGHAPSHRRGVVGEEGARVVALVEPAARDGLHQRVQRAGAELRVERVRDVALEPQRAPPRGGSSQKSQGRCCRAPPNHRKVELCFHQLAPRLPVRWIAIPRVGGLRGKLVGHVEPQPHLDPVFRGRPVGRHRARPGRASSSA